MRKVYLMNEMLDINNAKSTAVKEIITILNNEKILLCYIKDNENYKIYRREKITFLEVKEEEINITKGEYEIIKELVLNKNLDDLFIKNVYEFDNNTFFNIYGGKYQGLVTLEKDDEEEVNGIDITDCDIANDMKLLNMSFDEVQSEIAQLRITGTNLY